MYKSNEQVKCPYCNHELLEYGVADFTEDMIYYPWECKNCGGTGEEWYDLIFAGHNDDKGNIIE